MPEETEAIESTESVDSLETSTEVTQEPGYVVKIDGEEQQVSLEELQNGYQRQADYTRKTQEIAVERERLQQAEAIVSALENDPAGTLETLHRSFNVDTTASNQNEDLDYETDPTENRIVPCVKK